MSSYQENNSTVITESDPVFQALSHIQTLIPLKKRSSYLHDFKENIPSSSKSKIKTKVQDPVLRSRVLTKIDKLLQQNYSVIPDESKMFSVKIERELRQLDPSMTTKYKEKLLFLLKGLKKSLSLVFAHLHVGCVQ